MTELKKLRASLARHKPRTLDPGPEVRAAVAIIWTGSGEKVKLLILRRAEREGDPWSGHLAFPGGGIKKGDAGPRAAAERETEEETGVNLAAAKYLGRLDDVRSGHFPIVVSAFVYHLPGPPALTLSAEIAGGYWIPISHLTDPARRTFIALKRKEGELRLPALNIHAGEGPLLWGLTYRLLESILGLLGVPADDRSLLPLRPKKN